MQCETEGFLFQRKKQNLKIWSLRTQPTFLFWSSLILNS